MSAEIRYPEPPLLRRIDPESRWALKRFLIKLAAVGIFAGAIVQRPAVESVLILAYVNVLTSLIIAVAHRDRCYGGALNHWDEAVMFAGICALAHAVRAVIG
jgi:hypothetical protein